MYFFPFLVCCIVYNAFFSIINIISKLATAPISHVPQKGQEPTSPALQPTSKNHSNSVAPALSTSALAVSGTIDNSGLGLSEPKLRKQSLECLVAVLKSLVVWGTANNPNTESPGEPGSRPPTVPGEELRADTITPENSMDRLSAAPSLSESSRIPTPDPVSDDPTKFESAKQKKTTLLEGIKKFNFKPKRVWLIMCWFWDVWLTYISAGCQILH